ncbi:MAG: LA_3696 family protein [Gemmatimonadota bacterium]
MEGSEGSERPLIITIPEALRERLGPDGARALAELLNDTSMQTRGDVIEIAAGRFERRLAEELGKLRSEFHSTLQSEIGGLRAEMHSGLGEVRAELQSEIGGLRGELHSQVGGLRGELQSEIGGLRAEMGAFEGRITRWMFVFWIGQIGALLGILFAFFRT